MTYSITAQDARQKAINDTIIYDEITHIMGEIIKDVQSKNSQFYVDITDTIMTKSSASIVANGMLTANNIIAGDILTVNGKDIVFVNNNSILVGSNSQLAIKEDLDLTVTDLSGLSLNIEDADQNIIENILVHKEIKIMRDNAIFLNNPYDIRSGDSINIATNVPNIEILDYTFFKYNDINYDVMFVKNSISNPFLDAGDTININNVEITTTEHIGGLSNIARIFNGAYRGDEFAFTNVIFESDDERLQIITTEDFLEISADDDVLLKLGLTKGIYQNSPTITITSDNFDNIDINTTNISDEISQTLTIDGIDYQIRKYSYVTKEISGTIPNPSARAFFNITSTDGSKHESIIILPGGFDVELSFDQILQAFRNHRQVGGLGLQFEPNLDGNRIIISSYEELLFPSENNPFAMPDRPSDPIASFNGALMVESTPESFHITLTEFVNRANDITPAEVTFTILDTNTEDNIVQYQITTSNETITISGDGDDTINKIKPQTYIRNNQNIISHNFPVLPRTNVSGLPLEFDEIVKSLDFSFFTGQREAFYGFEVDSENDLLNIYPLSDGATINLLFDKTASGNSFRNEDKNIPTETPHTTIDEVVKDFNQQSSLITFSANSDDSLEVQFNPQYTGIPLYLSGDLLPAMFMINEFSQINYDDIVNTLNNSLDDSIIVEKELPDMIKFTYNAPLFHELTFGGSAQEKLELQSTYTATITDFESDLYYDVWQGNSPDDFRRETEMNEVIIYFKNLGYEIIRVTNIIDKTFKWRINY